jgi:hypothetical protein
MVACRIAKRKQALPAKDRRQLGYAVQTGKKDTGKTVLLTEDVAEALQEVSRVILFHGCMLFCRAIAVQSIVVPSRCDQCDGAAVRGCGRGTAGGKPVVHYNPAQLLTLTDTVQHGEAVVRLECYHGLFCKSSDSDLWQSRCRR